MRLKFILVSLISTFLAFSLLAREDENGERSFNKTTILDQIVNMDINNIDLPMKNDGSTGEDGQGYFPNGTQNTFLFSGGIATTARVDTDGDGVGDDLRASWMAPASLIEEFQPNKWGESPDDPKARWYVYDPLLPDADENGVPDIEEWGDAVDLGADWQEVPDSLDPNNENPNNDYNPDLGDLPDLLGNRVFWTVYNDGTPISLRTPRLQTDPIGIEVQQHTWAFARGDELGNVIFFRYKFVNPTDNFIDDLVFTIWTDPDLGDHEDDLIGSDTTLSLGYIYNDADDLQYGANPPAFGIDFFQGPVVESPGDTALLFRGPHFGVDTLLDHRNLPMTSFMYYINGDPTIGDPNNASIARNYQLGGLDADGVPIDPTQWGIGGTLETDPRFFYSGDPVTGEGWLDDTPADKRFMVNTGPFNLPPWEDTNGNGREDIGEPGVQFIVAAYVVGQGSDALGSVTKLKSVDVIAQRAYNANFVVAGPPPPPVVQTRTSDQKIELIIDLEEQGTYDYVKTDKLFNEQRFEGLRIYQFRSNATSEEVGGLDNIRRIASFDIDNKYGDIFVRQGDGGWAKVLDSEDNLDTTSFDNGAAILKYEITEDAFTGGPLINGTEYYFSVTSFSVNHGVRDVVDPATGDTIEVPFIERDDGPISITGNPNNWLASSSGDLLENSLSSNFITERPQSDEVQPLRSTQAEYTGTRPFFSDERFADAVGGVFVDVANPEELTGDDYEVQFSGNGEYWQLQNTSAGETVIDSVTYQGSSRDEWNFPIVDGLSVKVVNVPDSFKVAEAMIDESDTNAVVWLEGNGTQSLEGNPGGVYDAGINYVQYSTEARQFNPFPLDKANIFPVKVVFDTSASDQSLGQQFLSSWRKPVFVDELQPTPVTAYDMTDPDNPRQLYIAYTAAGVQPAPLNFPLSGQKFVVFDAPYQNTARYGEVASQDSLFRKEAYLVFDLARTADTLALANRMEIEITPHFPNSDVDTYAFQTQNLFPDLSQQEKESLLDKMKVVPNPYFAFSKYETSFDTPVLKFTHMNEEATIRIFNLAGQLVKTIRKNNNLNEVTWDLRNEAGLKVASGMYIAHVEVPGVGEKILKFAVVQREERIDQF